MFKVALLLISTTTITYMLTYKLAYDSATVNLNEVIEISKSIGYLTCMEDVNNTNKFKNEIKL